MLLCCFPLLQVLLKNTWYYTMVFVFLLTSYCLWNIFWTAFPRCVLEEVGGFSQSASQTQLLRQKSDFSWKQMTCFIVGKQLLNYQSVISLVLLFTKNTLIFFFKPWTNSSFFSFLKREVFFCPQVKEPWFVMMLWEFLKFILQTNTILLSGCCFTEFPKTFNVFTLLS